MTVLVKIKLLHTAVWAFFVAAIVGLPAAGLMRRFRLAAVLAGLVLIECAILACNRGRCPLTDLAARHTADRRANFDIYLPEWLARRNQAIFGGLFAAGGILALWRYLAQ